MSTLRTIESPVGAQIVLDGRRYINFAGSSYLGLSGNAQILEAGIEAVRTSGSGYQLARHYQIATRAHQQAEAQAAEFFQTEAALYLAGGYFFGLVALAALKERRLAVFFDEFAHYSLREAVGASGLINYAFRHLDVEDLEAKLKLHLNAGERPLILTDGLYSVFGEIAPLDQLARAASRYDGLLVVDESHSFGVLGNGGRGAAEHYDLPRESIVIGGSTCKALGAVGGIIPGSEQVVAAFRATPVGRGACAGLPAAAAMCARSLEYVRQHPELLERLRANVAHMKGGLRKIGLQVADNPAPVASFVCGTDASMQALQRRLMDEDIYVLYSTYLGAGAAGAVRCGIFADHTSDHIDRLLEVLQRLL